MAFSYAFLLASDGAWQGWVALCLSFIAFAATWGDTRPQPPRRRGFWDVMEDD